MSAPPFDPDAVAGVLREHGLLDGEPTWQRIGDGHSNLTYLVDDGTRGVVVRRPPPPPLPPGAHDVMREARVQRALADTAVPVARILHTDDERRVMDVPFYVMEHLDGEVATTRTPAALDTPAQRRAIGEALVDTLAALHAVDLAAAGLEDFGRPYSDAARHLKRFSRLVDPDEAGLDGELGALLAWLCDDPPVPSGPTLVHGDYRPGNVMLGRDQPAKILAVLDWELASIGDPLADVGYFLATYATTTEPEHALTAMSAATTAEGYPSRAELAERYATKRGVELGDIGWYTATALFKLAVLFEYQRRRVAEGIGDDYYATPGLVEGFLRAARPITTGVST